MSDPPRRVGDAGAVRPPESTYLDEFLPLNPQGWGWGHVDVFFSFREWGVEFFTMRMMCRSSIRKPEMSCLGASGAPQVLWAPQVWHFGFPDALVSFPLGWFRCLWSIIGCGRLHHGNGASANPQLWVIIFDHNKSITASCALQENPKFHHFRLVINEDNLYHLQIVSDVNLVPSCSKEILRPCDFWGGVHWKSRIPNSGVYVRGVLSGAWILPNLIIYLKGPRCAGGTGPCVLESVDWTGAGNITMCFIF